ncbi:thioredoxin, partial [Thermococcus sp. Bubb.Bath]|nr:thioredoxin [Thermococcus sp. Bubb.Bath]
QNLVRKKEEVEEKLMILLGSDS